MDRYTSIARTGESRLVVDKSVFLGFAAAARDEAEAAAFVADLRARYADARHVCYAYVLTEAASRYSDDGEPSQSAGPPILDALKKQGYSFAVCAVVRYFGGIKLGVGGLVRAYGACAREAIAAGGRAQYVRAAQYRIGVSYSDARGVEYLLRERAKEVEKCYGEGVSFSFAVPCGETDAVERSLADLLAGRAQAVRTGERFIGE